MNNDDITRAEDRFLMERRKFVLLGLMLADAYKTGESDDSCLKLMRRLEYQAEEMHFAFEEVQVLRERRANAPKIH